MAKSWIHSGLIKYQVWSQNETIDKFSILISQF